MRELGSEGKIKDWISPKQKKEKNFFFGLLNVLRVHHSPFFSLLHQRFLFLGWRWMQGQFLSFVPVQALVDLRK